MMVDENRIEETFKIPLQKSNISYTPQKYYESDSYQYYSIEPNNPSPQ